MNTNLLTAITIVTTVTNTFLRWPQKTVPDPCPGYFQGQSCAVFHAHSEDDQSQGVREEVTEIREIHTIRFPQLGLSHDVSNILKLRFTVPQTLVSTWSNGVPRTNVEAVFSARGLLWNLPASDGEAMLLRSLTIPK